MSVADFHAKKSKDLRSSSLLPTGMPTGTFALSRHIDYPSTFAPKSVSVGGSLTYKHTDTLSSTVSAYHHRSFTNNKSFNSVSAGVNIKY